MYIFTSHYIRHTYFVLYHVSQNHLNMWLFIVRDNEELWGELETMSRLSRFQLSCFRKPELTLLANRPKWQMWLPRQSLLTNMADSILTDPTDFQRELDAAAEKVQAMRTIPDSEAGMAWSIASEALASLPTASSRGGDSDAVPTVVVRWSYLDCFGRPQSARICPG